MDRVDGAVGSGLSENHAVDGTQCSGRGPLEAEGRHGSSNTRASCGTKHGVI